MNSLECPLRYQKPLMASSSNCLHKFIAGKTSMSGVKFPNLRNLSKQTFLYRCIVEQENVLCI
jgi:hypothetical protein